MPEGSQAGARVRPDTMAGVRRQLIQLAHAEGTGPMQAAELRTALAMAEWPIPNGAVPHHLRRATYAASGHVALSPAEALALAAAMEPRGARDELRALAEQMLAEGESAPEGHGARMALDLAAFALLDLSARWAAERRAAVS